MQQTRVFEGLGCFMLLRELLIKLKVLCHHQIVCSDLFYKMFSALELFYIFSLAQLTLQLDC